MNKIYFTFGLFLLSMFGYGQTDSLSIPSEQVEVVKRYEAAILQARKKKINYSIQEKESSPISYNYNVTTEKVIDFDRPDPEIRALGYTGEPVQDGEIKNGYVYGAYGNYRTINAGAAYHYYIEDWLETGFKVDHFSARDSLLVDFMDEPSKKFANTNIDAYLGYYLGKQTKINLKSITSISDRNVVYSDSLISVPLNKVGADLELSHNVFEDKGFALRVGGNYLKTSSDTLTEHKYGGRLNIIKSFSENLTFELPFSYERAKGFGLDYVADFVVEPKLRLQGQNYGLVAGLQYITGDNVSSLFPLIELKLESVFAGIDLRLYTTSDYQRNSFSNLSELHPYHFFYSDDYSGSFLKSYNLGLDYQVQNVDLSLDFSYEVYDNEINFTDYSFPVSEYVDRDAFVIRPEIVYRPNEELSVGLDFEYNFFLTDSLNLYYKPQLKFNLHAKQTLLDKRLELVQMISFVGTREVGELNFTDFQVRELPSFWDLSLRINYKISPSFDVFAKGTNLLGQDYNLWQPIYAHKQQLWAGIKFRI